MSCLLLWLDEPICKSTVVTSSQISNYMRKIENKQFVFKMLGFCQLSVKSYRIFVCCFSCSTLFNFPLLRSFSILSLNHGERKLQCFLKPFLARQHRYTILLFCHVLQFTACFLDFPPCFKYFICFSWKNKWR